MAQSDLRIEWLTFLIAAIAWSVFFFLGARHAEKEKARETGETLRKWTGRYSPKAIALSCLSITSFLAMAYVLLFPLVAPDFTSLMILSNLPILWLRIIPYRESLEICRNGIVIYREAARNFIAWRNIECVRLSLARDSVVIDEPACRWKPYHLPPGNIDEAIKIMRPFVLLRDRSGQMLNPEFRVPDRVTQPPDRRKWQISLRTILLLFILASCTLSWYSLYHRREAAKEELLTKLHHLDPLVLGQGGSELAFYGLMPQEPQDEDMKIIAQWPGLSRLTLIGAPITDSGLECLREVRTLRVLDVSATQVTAQGVNKLKHELPSCDVHSNF